MFVKYISYIKLGEFTKAAKLLSRRKDPECLEIASQLAFMSDDVEFGMLLAEDAMVCALMKLNYSKACSIIENIQGLQVQTCIIHISIKNLNYTYKRYKSLDIFS